jgi:hypothetical protein
MFSTAFAIVFLDNIGLYRRLAVLNFYGPRSIQTVATVSTTDNVQLNHKIPKRC